MPKFMIVWFDDLLVRNSGCSGGNSSLPEKSWIRNSVVINGLNAGVEVLHSRRSEFQNEWNFTTNNKAFNLLILVH